MSSIIYLKTQSNIYPCIYKDQLGQLNCTIENRFAEEDSPPLFLTIDGLKFSGYSFDDFRLINKEDTEPYQLDRFTFNTGLVSHSNEKVYELCNCELIFSIPVLIADNQYFKGIEPSLEVKLKLGKPAPNGGIDYENAIFTINIRGENYSSEGDVFEVALVELQNQFEDQYHFKNCFGCLYSDYSPYGNGFFGDLICFRNCKKDYLNADSKRKLLELLEKDTIMVQETYCCPEFKERVKNTGYRG